MFKTSLIVTFIVLSAIGFVTMPDNGFAAGPCVNSAQNCP